MGWEDSLGEENGSPLHYSCLENSMDSDFHYYITRQVVTDKSKIWTYMFDSKSKLLNAVLLNEKNIKKSEKYLKGSYSGVWKRRIPEVSHD